MMMVMISFKQKSNINMHLSHHKCDFCYAKDHQVLGVPALRPLRVVSKSFLQLKYDFLTESLVFKSSKDFHFEFKHCMRRKNYEI